MTSILGGKNSCLTKSFPQHKFSNLIGSVTLRFRLVTDLGVISLNGEGLNSQRSSHTVNELSLSTSQYKHRDYSLKSEDAQEKGQG